MAALARSLIESAALQERFWERYRRQQRDRGVFLPPRKEKGRQGMAEDKDDDLAGLSDESKKLFHVLEARTKTLIVAEIKQLSVGVQRQLDAIARNIDDLILESVEDDEQDDEHAETNGHPVRCKKVKKARRKER
jgi:hypothetical protein